MVLHYRGFYWGVTFSLLYFFGGSKSKGLRVPSSGLLNPFWQLSTQRAESWESRWAAEPAPQTLVERPFRNRIRKVETGTAEKVYRLPWYKYFSPNVFSFVHLAHTYSILNYLFKNFLAHCMPGTVLDREV